MEQTDQDFQEIERDRDLPPDELYETRESDEDEASRLDEEARLDAEAFAYHLREEQRNDPV